MLDSIQDGLIEVFYIAYIFKCVCKKVSWREYEGRMKGHIKSVLKGMKE